MCANLALVLGLGGAVTLPLWQYALIYRMVYCTLCTLVCLCVLYCMYGRTVTVWGPMVPV